MIRIENTWTGGFEGAIRGMRNPYMSHDKSDSAVEDRNYESRICGDCRYGDYDEHRCNMPYFDDEVEQYGVQYIIGNNDMTLAKKLIKAGPEHRKFLRMIHVQADVVAPRYWWAEMDKYKWVEANSSSTMHLITKRELTIDDFSHDGALDIKWLESVVNGLNFKIRAYNNMSGDEKEQTFKDIKQLLPESYNQLRTIDTNYEALLSIHHQRHNHRLSEWHEFSAWIESLPYMHEFLEVMNG